MTYRRCRSALIGATIAAAATAALAHSDIRLWTGLGDGGSWEDPANWSGNALPGPDDDVVINVGTGVALTVADATVASITCTRPFVIGGGSLTVVGDFTVGSTSLTINGGTIVGTPRVTNTTISIADSLITPITVVALGGGNSVVKHGSALGTIVVRGGSDVGNGTLVFPDGLINGGRIVQELTTTGGWSSSLFLAGSFTNGPDGVIETLGAGGFQQVIGPGSFVNEGLMALAADEVYRIQNVGDAEFRAGTIEIANRVDRGNGPMIVSGGSVSGELRVIGSSSIRMKDTLTEAIDVVVVGLGVEIVEHASALGHVILRGGSSTGNGSLMIDEGFVNAGRITLEATSAGGWLTQLATTGPFTNGPQGTIATAGTGALRRITGIGGFVNEGTLDFASPDTVSVQTNEEFELRSGAVSVAGAIERPTGTLRVSGGTLSGELRATGTASIRVTDTLTAPITVVVLGGSCMLEESESPLGTIVVRGGSDVGNGRLRIAHRMVNRGRIRLQLTSAGGWASDIEPLGTFTNGFTGVIDTLGNPTGTAGLQRIVGVGNLTNAGRLIPGRGLTSNVWMTFTPTSALEIDIAGTASGQFSRLVVNNAITLNGVLEVLSSGGYVPADGDTFTIVQAVSRTGQFISVSPCSTTLIDYTPTEARLTYSLGSGVFADIDGNGIVDGADLGLMLNAWGPCGSGCCLADLNSDGVVDGADLGLMLNAWG